VMFDICSGDEWNAWSESLASPVQYGLLFCIRQVVHISGVHVDGVHQSGSVGGNQVLRKGVDRDSAIRFVWQQDSGYAMNLTSRLFAPEQLLDCHARIPIMMLHSEKFGFSVA
jgi:hypothetical protein